MSIFPIVSLYVVRSAALIINCSRPEALSFALGTAGSLSMLFCWMHAVHADTGIAFRQVQSTRRRKCSEWTEWLSLHSLEDKLQAYWFQHGCSPQLKIHEWSWVMSAVPKWTCQADTLGITMDVDLSDRESLCCEICCVDHQLFAPWSPFVCTRYCRQFIHVVLLDACSACRHWDSF